MRAWSWSRLTQPLGIAAISAVVLALLIVGLRGARPAMRAHPGATAAALHRDPVAFFATPRGKALADQRLLDVFSAQGVAIARAATRVEAFRIIDPAWHRGPAGPLGSIDDFPITAREGDQGPEFATTLANQMLDGRVYAFLSPDCLEDPGVAFRLWSGAEAVDLVICYECYHLQVFVHAADGHTTHRGNSFFAIPLAGPDRLPRLAKQAFPTDPLIQALKEPQDAQGTRDPGRP